MGAELSFGWERVADVMGAPNIRELIEAQFEELSVLKSVAPLDIDVERMVKMEAAGIFKMWGVRADGMLIGGVRLYVMPHLDHKGTLFAYDAGYYIAPEFRGAWVGYKMWRGLLRELQNMGVGVVMSHDNHLRPLGPLFRRLGFTPCSTVYYKGLP